MLKIFKNEKFTTYFLATLMIAGSVLAIIILNSDIKVDESLNKPFDTFSAAAWLVEIALMLTAAIVLIRTPNIISLRQKRIFTLLILLPIILFFLLLLTSAFLFFSGLANKNAFNTDWEKVGFCAIFGKVAVAAMCVVFVEIFWLMAALPVMFGNFAFELLQKNIERKNFAIFCLFCAATTVATQFPIQKSSNLSPFILVPIFVILFLMCCAGLKIIDNFKLVSTEKPQNGSLSASEP